MFVKATTDDKYGIDDVKTAFLAKYKKLVEADQKPMQNTVLNPQTVPSVEQNLSSQRTVQQMRGTPAAPGQAAQDAMEVQEPKPFQPDYRSTPALGPKEVVTPFDANEPANQNTLEPDKQYTTEGQINGGGGDNGFGGPNKGSMLYQKVNGPNVPQQSKPFGGGVLPPNFGNPKVKKGVDPNMAAQEERGRLPVSRKNKSKRAENYVGMLAFAMDENMGSYERKKFIPGEHEDLSGEPTLCSMCGNKVYSHQEAYPDKSGSGVLCQICSIKQDQIDEHNTGASAAIIARMDDFQKGYVEAALWSSMDNSNDSGGDPLDKNYSPENIAPETLQEMVQDCNDFVQVAAAQLEQSGLDDVQAGRDFWLSRNGHGAGYFDRGLGQIGEELQKLAKSYGSYDLYIGDTGLIHGS
jgi:hypothetical protein